MEYGNFNIQYDDKVDLNLELKGGRGYLHGTDIALVLLSHIGGAKKITIQFHKVSYYPLTAYWVTKEEISRLKEMQLLSAVMAYMDRDGKRRFVAIVENKFGTISGKYEYDETKVIVDALVHEKSIIQKTPGPGDFFERTVSLNKYLLNSVVCECSWVFSRIDLDGYPIEPNTLCLTLVSEVGGHTYKSTVASEDVLLGSIYFTRLEA